MDTAILSPDDAGTDAAAALLTRGALVAMPTETVYGLAGDARNGTAVASIYEAKGRPSFNPLIVHVADAAAAEAYGVWSDTAARLARAFWPGPLTLVLPLSADAGLSSLVTAGQETVALRVPAHPAAQALLRRFGGPLAAPSANPSGRISPTSAAHVMAGLGGRIAAILDGGACGVGVESTILGLGADGAATLLRPGGLAAEDIEAALDASLTRHSGGPISAPGQLSSHYAPRAALRLGAERAGAGEVLLGFGPDEAATLNLSPTGDLREAAATLFAHLHRLDGMAARIAVAPIPERGLGRAINDRLRRAAASRDGA